MNKLIITSILLLLITPSYAQVSNEELTELYKACEPHLKRVKSGPTTLVNGKLVGGRYIEKWEEGWEGCAKVTEEWNATKQGLLAAEQKAKEEAYKAKIDAMAKRLAK